ncbi:hypothetical protein ACFYNO_04795 [Kitasatospora sp. NPDC006697]|uniref:hypothetical protein n=1 Tax=Kitasatospora sp. NPDC006697 TaxID=3364020 RepID=UPI003680EE0D
MKWQDGQGVKWRLKKRRLAWFRRVDPGIALDLFPSGLGDDPISFLIALPGLVVITVLSAAWTVEFVLRLLLAPFAAVLRLVGVLPYRIELWRRGEVVAVHYPHGLAERRRVITDLRR